jgi:hypothetical protein
MKHILIATVVLAILSGCESKEDIERENAAKLYKEQQQQKIKEAQAVAEQKAREENNASTLSKVGISMDDGKLIIDTNKAKDFFTQLADGFQETSKKIDKELKEGNLTATKAMGIEVSNEKLTIDINETKSFFESWGEKMESFSKEIDKLTEVINSKDDNLSNNINTKDKN